MDKTQKSPGGKEADVAANLRLQYQKSDLITSS